MLTMGNSLTKLINLPSLATESVALFLQCVIHMRSWLQSKEVQAIATAIEEMT